MTPRWFCDTLERKNPWPLPQRLTTDLCLKSSCCSTLYCFSPVCLTVTMSHRVTCQRGLGGTEHTAVSHSVLRGMRVSVHVKGVLLVHRGCWWCTCVRTYNSKREKNKTSKCHTLTCFRICGSCNFRENQALWEMYILLIDWIWC